MKAYELNPQHPEALELAERASPTISEHDVLVRVRAVSLNYRDLVVRRGTKRRQAKLIPASDGAGDVIAVGGGVSRLKVGDRVAAAFFPTWMDGELSEEHHAHALGGACDGMFAEEVALPEMAWVKVPDQLSFEEAATLPCAGVTAYHALFEAAQLHPGDSVLLQGTGGVSLFALQLAKASGARVIVTSQSAAKRERALGMGADEVIDYREHTNWGELANAWAGGRGVDIAVEVGGPGTFDQTVAALRYGGTMGLLGVLTGTKGEINTYAIFHKALRIRGIYVGPVRMFEALNRAIVATGLKPMIDRTFEFDEANAAYEHLASGQHFGKVVVRI